MATEPIVATTTGKVRGRERNGVHSFLGIPYAASPAGAGRFRPPRPAEPWEGVRDALVFGPSAPQIGEGSSAGGMLDGIDPAAPQSEDCLSLNVWASVAADGPLPVLVWIHGGGLRSGGSSAAVYDGHALAAGGPAVVVTINYRLGVLGYLCHPALREEPGGPCGNWGLLDQLAALAWIRDNIAAFGGDPANVTLFGQSAGGSSIANLLALRKRTPLFHKAIVQSGAPKAAPLEEAAGVAERLLAILGIEDVQALRNVPVADILRAQQEIEGPAAPMVFITAVDGGVLPEHPIDLVRNGAAEGVPILFGTTRDEWRRFLGRDPRAQTLDDTGLARRLERALPGDPAEIIAVYRRGREGRGERATPGDIWFDVAGDTYFRIPSYRLADAAAASDPRLYAYLFTWPSPARGGVHGAHHSLEIPFVFGTYAQPSIATLTGEGPAVAALSRAMMAAWVAFARDGDPSTPELGPWPRYEPRGSQAVMALGATRGVEHAPMGEAFTLVERRFPGQPTRPLGISRG